MTIFHVGCAGWTRGRARYLTRLRFVEIDLRPPVPSPKVLGGWQREVPAGFSFAAVAPPTLYGDPTWPLRDAARTRSELDRVSTHVRALGAAITVFRTPVSLTPGSAALHRFNAVLDQARKILPETTRIVWEPTGLWEHDEAVAVMSHREIIVASDPLHTDVSADARVYARMRGLGVDGQYDPGRLESLTEAVAHADEVFVVFQSNRAWAEAIAMSRLTDSAIASDDDDGDDGDDDPADDDGDDEEDIDDDEAGDDEDDEDEG